MKKETPWTPHEVEMALELAGLYIGRVKPTRRSNGPSSTRRLADALNKVITLEVKENVHERNTDNAKRAVQPDEGSPEVVAPVVGAEPPAAAVIDIRDAKPVNSKRH